MSSSSLSFSRSAPRASSAAPPQSHPTTASLADAALTLPGRGAVARRATPATREEEPELARRPWRARARCGWGGRGQRRESAPRAGGVPPPAGVQRAGEQGRARTPSSSSTVGLCAYECGERGAWEREVVGMFVGSTDLGSGRRNLLGQQK